MKTNEHTIKARLAHHKALEALARQVGCNVPGLTLWRKLSRLERSVHLACEQYSSDPAFGVDRWEAIKADATKQLAAIFGGTIPTGIFINGDPRGHSLKLDAEQVTVPEGMSKDWGSDGILAAEIE